MIPAQRRRLARQLAQIGQDICVLCAAVGLLLGGMATLGLVP